METLGKLGEMIRRETFNALGVAVDATHLASLDKNWAKIETVQIAPAMFGPIAQIFTKIECNVYAAVNAGFLHVGFEYRYEHPTGMNGYRLDKTFAID